MVESRLWAVLAAALDRVSLVLRAEAYSTVVYRRKTKALAMPGLAWLILEARRKRKPRYKLSEAV